MLKILDRIIGTITNWLVVCGFVKLITLCFGLAFNWLIATGIWLIARLIKFVFH